MKRLYKVWASKVSVEVIGDNENFKDVYEEYFPIPLAVFDNKQEAIEFCQRLNQDGAEIDRRSFEML